MFIVNGEILSQKNTPELYKWYQDQLKEIDQSTSSDHVIFSSHKNPHFETDDSGRKRKTRRFKSVPATSTIDNGDFGHQTWTYVPSANSVTNENGMIKPVNLKPFIIGYEQSFSKKKDKDIIFYLLKISEAYKRKRIIHIDKERDSIAEAQEHALAAEAQYLLYNATSPCSPETTGSEQSIRQIAISFGIPNVDGLHLAEVRNMLWKFILNNEKTHNRNTFGFKGFIGAANRVKDSAKRATILTAVELGILQYKDFNWSLHMKGMFDKILCSVPQNEVKKNKEPLIAYVLENPEYFELIKNAVNNPEESKAAEESPEKLDRSEMIDKCARLGWEKGKLYKMKNTELKQIIDNEVQPE